MSSFPVIGVVPVGNAPAAVPAALAELDGVPLVRRAVEALLGSGRVGRVVVPAPPDLVPALRAALGDLDADVVHPLGELPDGATVVVHDPWHPLAPPQLVGAVLDALERPGGDAGEPAGVIAVRPVTDTLKQVGADGVVTATVDRQAFWTACTPQAYRWRLVPPTARALLAAGAPAQALPGAVRAAGGRLATVVAPGEVFRVGTPGELALAEATLHAG